MIGRLRRKFVLAMMSVVTVILLIVFLAALISVRQEMRQGSEDFLQRVIEEEPEPPLPQRPGGEKEGIKQLYLVVEQQPDGTWTVIEGSDPLMEEEQELQQVIASCLEREESRGVLAEDNLRYLRKTTRAGRERIAFSDRTLESQMLSSLIRNSLAIGAGGLAAFFIISLLLARWAVRPVRQAWERQREFVADASHEMKTPLTVILSNADMLLSHAGQTDKVKKWGENIKMEAVRMRRLVESLLLLARTEVEIPGEEAQAVDLSDLTEECLLSWEPVLFEKGRSLEERVEPGLEVTGRRDQLRQVLEILLDNALKYSQEGGRITLRLERSGRKSILLSVRNTGWPLQPQQLSRLFERFYRADDARPDDGGYGLGLPIARNLVQSHRGKIWAESGEAGNTFFVQLPARGEERGEK